MTALAHRLTATSLTGLLDDLDRQMPPRARRAVRGAVNAVARTLMAERWRIVRLLYPRGGFSFDQPIGDQIDWCRILLTEARRQDGFGRGFVPLDEARCIDLMAGALALRWLRRFA